MSSHSQRLGDVFLHQQVDSLRTILHTARGIDARPYLEDNVAHGQFTARQSANVNNGLQAYRRRLVELLQPVEGQDAVLACHRDDVGCNGYGTEVKQRNEPREGDAVVLGKSLHELESHATAAQMLERIGGVHTLGIEDGHSRRQFLIGHVMVADDKVYAKRVGIVDFFDCLDAAVEHNNQFNVP